MRRDYLIYAINGDATRLVPQRDHFPWAPAFSLADLDRRGRSEFCRIAGCYTLSTLRLCHPAAIGHLSLDPPTGQVVDFEGIDPAHHPVTHTGELRENQVVVGLGDSGEALEVSEFAGRRRLTLPRYLEVTDLASQGSAAAFIIGTEILDGLQALYPDVFARYPHLAQ